MLGLIPTTTSGLRLGGPFERMERTQDGKEKSEVLWHQHFRASIGCQEGRRRMISNGENEANKLDTVTSFLNK